MTELKRLEISGIRSFKANPDDINTQSIDFEGPITLITGENGTGKTTIIESLKFATMGKCTEEMITDPSIWGQNEIRARVSLTFKSVNQNTYQINLNPSIKKSKTTKKEKSFSRGDCDIVTITPEGNRITKTINKSTDIETQIPNLLGVSPPIIENVIFCHQKDSCWPIDCNTRDLKEKFDEIFGTEKYYNATKALKETLKILKEKINSCKIEVSKQNERYTLYTKSEKKIASLKREIIELDNEFKEDQITFEDINSTLEEFNKIKPKIEAIESSIQNINGQIQSEARNMEEIKKKIKNFQSSELSKSELESVSTSIEEITNKLKENSDFLRENHPKQQSIKSQKERLRDEIGTMDIQLISAKSERDFYQKNLKRFKEEYGSENLDLILDQKKQFLANADNELQKISKDAINKKNDEIRFNDSKLSSERTILFSLQSNLKEQQNQLSKISFNEKSLEEALHDYTQAKNNFDEFQKEQNEARDFKQQIEELAQKKKEIGQQKDGLEIQEMKCRQHGENLNALKNAEERIQEATKHIVFHFNEIQNGMNDENLNPENAEKIFNYKCSELTSEINNLEKKRSEINNNYIGIIKQIEFDQKLFDKKEKQIEEAKNKIFKIIQPGDDYKSLLEDAEKFLSEEKDHLAGLKNSEDVFKDFKRKAEVCGKDGFHACPLCKRNFENDDDYHRFVQNDLDGHISSLPNLIRKSEFNKKMYEDKIKDLKSIENDVKIYETNLSQRNESIAKLNSLKEKSEEIKIELDKINKELNSKKEFLDNFKKLLPNITAMNQKIKDKKESINLRNQISSKIDSSLPSIEDVQSEIDRCSTQIAELTSKIEKIYQSRENIRETRDNLKNKLTLAQNNYKNLKDNQEKMKFLTDKINNINSEISNKSQVVKELEEKGNTLQNEYKHLSENYENEIKEKTNIKSAALDDYKQCNALSEQIKLAERKLKEIDSGEMSQKQAEMKSRLSKIEDEYEEITRKIKNCRSENDDLNASMNRLKEQETDLQLLNDYYKKEFSYNALNEELKKLKKDKSMILDNFHNFDVTEIDERCKQIKSKMDATNAKMSQMQKQLKEENDTATEYEQSKKLLSEESIRLKSTEMAKKDIDRYIKALDDTILKYHTQKMDEINDTIRCLWSNTYFGQDIDSIKICCEGENTKRAQYNYRVVMLKNGVELDMSKRCSAGQKMLASIIIRLALAQTFALNCGIIALDEPTTNLDEQNRKNLATQLIDLVNVQDKDGFRKPFQLVIITHSREFVQALAQEGTIESFYQITRVIDDSHHCSQIKKCTETNLVIRQ